MDNIKINLTLSKYKKKYLKYKSKYLQNKKGGIGESVIPNPNPIKAISWFDGIITGNIKGTVYFEEIIEEDRVKVMINLSGFEPNSIHGFHVHESGDLTKGCDSMCAHFNPHNLTHGGQDDTIRHVGDLGNIIADHTGLVQMEFIDNQIKLRGEISNIIGRGLIIHADPDDCGKGSHPTSKTTGNSGKRIACSVIGYASNC